MDEKLKSNVKSGRTWVRLIFIILFALCLQVISFILCALVVVQFLFVLFSGKDNINLRQFGDSLSQYIYQVVCFLTFVSDKKPFPFSDWPESELDHDAVESEPDENVETGENAVKEVHHVVKSNQREESEVQTEDDAKKPEGSGNAKTTDDSESTDGDDTEKRQ